jgi:DNA/RNA endonuclease YhcR with UshA esterase domain
VATRWAARGQAAPDSRPAAAVPDPAPQNGELLECYGVVSTYAGAKELTIRDARDLVRIDQE